MNTSSPLPQQISSLRFNDKDIDFLVESGVVVGVRKFSETYASGSVSQGSGSISSKVVNVTEYAVIGIDGVERSHFLRGHELYLRDGHRVSLIFASCGSPVNAAVVNHSTREHILTRTPTQIALELGLGEGKLGCGCVLIGGVISVLFTMGVFKLMPGLNTMPDTVSETVSGAAFFAVLLIVILINTRRIQEHNTLLNNCLGPELERIRLRLFDSTDRMSWPLYDDKSKP